MGRNRLNAGYIGAGKISTDQGSLTGEYLFHKALTPATSSEEVTTYDLDGTNIMSLKPQWHFQR